jgi:hypothetical protein
MWFELRFLSGGSNPSPEYYYATRFFPTLFRINNITIFIKINGINCQSFFLYVYMDFILAALQEKVHRALLLWDRNSYAIYNCLISFSSAPQENRRNDVKKGMYYQALNYKIGNYNCELKSGDFLAINISNCISLVIGLKCKDHKYHISSVDLDVRYIYF